MQVKLIELVFHLILFQYSITALAQSDVCNNNEFDFWIGEWDIKQEILNKDGTYTNLEATNSVKKEVSGCAIIENWEGDVLLFWEGMTKPEKILGYSIRTYNNADSTWSIYWMDTRTKTLSEPFVGKFSNGIGEFFRENEAGRSKIIFSDIKEPAILWELFFFDKNSHRWVSIWKMKFHRKK
jgi:hypothetical protein